MGPIRETRRRCRWRAALWISLVAVALPALAGAADVGFFRMHSRDAFLGGDLSGVGIDALGTLYLTDRAERLVDIEEPYLLSAVPHPDGWVVGTGNSGRVLLVSRDGRVETLYEASEPQIFAVTVDPDGSVYAGSSPDGAVYRIRDGEVATVFEPGETYIWALARSAGGELLVATGTSGKLYAVDAAGRGRVLYETEDTHVRSLEPLGDGSTLVGSASEGLILLLDADGSARTLLDASEPEVVAFACAPDGTCYAALLASEATLTPAAQRPAPSEQSQASAPGSGPVSGPQPQVTVIAEGDVVSSSSSSSGGPRSLIVRIDEGGYVEPVWSFEDESVYDLLWHRDRLWIATGLDGKLFTLTGNQIVLEKDVDERQIVALMVDDEGPALATTNAAALYRLIGGPEREGTYTSPALDAGKIADFGSLRWTGELPNGASVHFRFRSGMSSDPDKTWSDWTSPVGGREVAIAGVPAARYVQWRAELRAANGASPVLREVDVSYRQRNLPPKIEQLSALEPGEILVPSNFNPSNQVFEPLYPNREGIFTTLSPAVDRDERRMKTLWKRGFRTLKWSAEDPNGDSLEFDIAFRPEEGSRWFDLEKGVDTTYHSFDATSLPDGVYRFRVTARDAADSSSGGGRASEEISEPILVDHSPARLASSRRAGGGLEVILADALSPLRTVELSVDAERWRALEPADGLLDGTRETFSVVVEAGSDLVLLRVMDAAYNTVTYNLGVEGR